MFLFLIFSCRTLNNFHKLLVIIVISNENKRNDHINNIMSKRRDKIYLLKTLLKNLFTEKFFPNAGKIENVLEFDKFEKF